jgi:hypothetical protein
LGFYGGDDCVGRAEVVFREEGQGLKERSCRSCECCIARREEEKEKVRMCNGTVERRRYVLRGEVR